MTQTQAGIRAERIGQIIKARRYVRGMSTAELGQAVGVSDRYIRYIERGESFPSAPVYRRIADVLGIDASDDPFAQLAKAVS